MTGYNGREAYRCIHRGMPYNYKACRSLAEASYNGDRISHARRNPSGAIPPNLAPDTVRYFLRRTGRHWTSSQPIALTHRPQKPEGRAGWEEQKSLGETHLLS